MKARDWWTAGFVLLVGAPVVLRFLTVERQAFWQEIITLTGLLACALIVCVVVLPSRIRSLTKAFGIEKIMGSHRSLGVVLVCVVLVHIAAVVIADPRGVALLVPLLNPRAPAQPVIEVPLLTPLLTPPYKALAGIAATVALIALAGVSSQGRRYERWRLLHLGLTGVVFLGTVVHVVLINHLVPFYQFVNYLFDPLGFPVLHAAMADPLALSYLLGLVLVVLATGIHRWVIRPMSRAGRYEVTDLRHVAPAVAVLTLTNDGRGGPRFRAGQFAWLRLHKDPFDEEHPFTVTSAEQSQHSVEFTIREVGSWTSRIPALTVGDKVWLDGPHGNFTPEDAQNPMVLIAGGVGIAPMMSILRTAASDGRHVYRREIALVLTDREDDRIFRDELDELRTDLRLTINELNGQRLSADSITQCVPTEWEAEYYVCGSPSLVEAALSALTEVRVPAHRIHTERFDM